MGAVRFVPPPGWPAVTEGQFPPQDWKPDSVPAAPANWVFYVDEMGAPVEAPIGAWRPPVVEVPPVFHSPPSWPAVLPGFIPPASWRPEQSWPPAPEGWVFYRDVAGQPAEAPVGSWRPGEAIAKNRGQGKVALISTGVSVLVIALGLVAYFALMRPSAPAGVTVEQFAKVAGADKIGNLELSDHTFVDVKPDISSARKDDVPSCKSAFDWIEQHIVRNASGKDSAQLYFVFAELWDSEDAAAKAAENIAPCRAAQGQKPWKVVTTFDQDGATVVELVPDEPTVDTVRTEVRFQNVVFTINCLSSCNDSYVEPFVTAAAAQLRDAGR